MMIARLLTIGTEITAGEVVNSNAAWISERLEDLGLRVYSHLSVRDQREEILNALAFHPNDQVLVVTGGLGPTSDDITRACVAEFAGVELEFDETVWQDLVKSNESRNLPVREAHRHQCYFPRGCTRLENPAGTALGFAMTINGREVFVLPGPPRELAAMWTTAVEPRLRPRVPAAARRWVRWTCIGVPESEVAELIEPLTAGRDLEVGYRAQVPYVRVKIFADPAVDQPVVDRITAALDPFVVTTGAGDLADELLALWPYAQLHVVDHVTRLALINRLFEAQRGRQDRGVATPEILFYSTQEPQQAGSGLILNFAADELHTELHLAGKVETDKRRMMYKLKLDSDRGRRAAAEWAIWHGVKFLRTKS